MTKNFPFLIAFLIHGAVYLTFGSYNAQANVRSPAPSGCYYQEVQCIQAPCDPILICPTPTPKPMQIVCEDLSVASGNNQNVPAKVVLRTRIKDPQNQVQKYRFYFGDGKQEEANNPEINHTYEVSGEFIARVDIQDKNGNWQTSSKCETKVTVKQSKVESHKSACSDVFTEVGNNGVAPSTVRFTVSGYDNKKSIETYKINFGTGVEKEGSGRTFEQIYEKPGTYTVKGYIKDSEGNWLGGGACEKTFTLAASATSSIPMKTQPQTGTPTALLIASITGLGAGIIGMRHWKKLH